MNAKMRFSTLVCASLSTFSMLIAGCGGETGRAPAVQSAESSGRHIQSEVYMHKQEPLTIIPIRLQREADSSNPGWDRVTVEFGIRNSSSNPQEVDLSESSAEVIIAGGEASYDAELQINPKNLYGVPNLPTGIAYCGEYDGGKVVAPTAVVNIPHALKLDSLSITGFPAIDLTARFRVDACRPTLQKRTPKAPASVTFPNVSSAQVTVEGVEKFAQLGLTRLNAQVSNKDKYANLDQSFHMLLLDGDGVFRSHIYRFSGSGDVDCDLESSLYSSGNIIVPPASTERVRLCYPSRPNRNPVAVIIQPYESSSPAVVRLPAAD